MSNWSTEPLTDEQVIRLRKAVVEHSQYTRVGYTDDSGKWHDVLDVFRELGRRAENARSALDTLRTAVAKTSTEVDTMLGLPNDIARREGYLAGLEAAVCVLESGEMPDEVRRG